MLKSKTSPFDLLETSPSNKKYVKYFESMRWKKGKPVSPFDSTAKVYKLADGWYKCSITKKRFNVKTGTILVRTKLPLRKWFLALCFFAVKKGISSYELSKRLSVTQKTAWNLLKDIRSSVKQSNFIKDMLESVVEIDETFIGGKNKNRHKNKKVPNSQGRSWKDKMPVLGILERNGNLIAQVVPNTQQNTIEPIIREHIKKGSNVYTDEWFAYKDLNKWFNHQIVNHRIKQYAKIDSQGNLISTNSIEGVWSQFKNAIHGTYHNNVSDKYLQNYADEFAFKFNTRKWKEWSRCEFLLSTVLGNHLTYQAFNQLKCNW